MQHELHQCGLESAIPWWFYTTEAFENLTKHKLSLELCLENSLAYSKQHALQASLYALHSMEHWL